MNKKFIFTVLSALSLIGYGVFVFAAPPSPGGYTPGTELDPDCNPGQSISNGDPYDCFVKSSIMSANNGLTATGSNIQLGGVLLQNTTIDANGNSFFVANNGNSIYSVHYSGNTYTGFDNSGLGTISGASMGILNMGTNKGASMTYSYNDGSYRKLGFYVDNSIISMSNNQAGPENIGSGIYIENWNGILKFSGDNDDNSIHSLWQNTDESDLSGNTHNEIAVLRNNGNWSWPMYLSSRDDSGSQTPVNFLYTNSSGDLLSAPLASLGNSSWSLAGNADTVPGTDFIGTTDAQDFMVKTNGNQIALFGQIGNVAIGAEAPPDFFNVGDPAIPAPVASTYSTFAFGSGSVSSGIGAVSLGIKNTSSEIASFAAGFGNQASGVGSVALGLNAIASGFGSFAFSPENNAIASGSGSVAFGDYAEAQGSDSFAFGAGTTAYSVNEIAFGSGNTSYIPSNTGTDRLFSISYGFDAFTILKNGKVGIGIDNFETTTSSALLQVGDSNWTGDMAHFENSAGSCTITNPSGWTCSSDERLKTNIKSLNTYGLNSIIALRPVTFDWIHGSNPTSTIGFIAQEVKTIIPDIVTTNNEDGLLSLNTTQMTPILVKAIQEMNLNIIELTNMEQPNTWRDSLIAWFGNIENGITDLYAKIIHTDRVETKELCVGSVCVTEDQFLQVMNQSGQSEIIIQIDQPVVDDSTPVINDNPESADDVPPETTETDQPANMDPVPENNISTEEIPVQ